MKNEYIKIENDGEYTVASYFVDGKNPANATAKCHPDDEFDIFTGARVALNRLEKKIKADKWTRFKRGDFAIVVPAKKIPEFLDLAANKGIRWTDHTLANKWHDYRNWIRFDYVYFVCGYYGMCHAKYEFSDPFAPDYKYLAYPDFLNLKDE